MCAWLNVFMEHATYHVKMCAKCNKTPIITVAQRKIPPLVEIYGSALFITIVDHKLELLVSFTKTIPLGIRALPQRYTRIMMKSTDPLEPFLSQKPHSPTQKITCPPCRLKMTLPIHVLIGKCIRCSHPYVTTLKEEDELWSNKDVRRFKDRFGMTHDFVADRNTLYANKPKHKWLLPEPHKTTLVRIGGKPVNELCVPCYDILSIQAPEIFIKQARVLTLDDIDDDILLPLENHACCWICEKIDSKDNLIHCEETPSQHLFQTPPLSCYLCNHCIGICSNCGTVAIRQTDTLCTACGRVAQLAQR